MCYCHWHSVQFPWKSWKSREITPPSGQNFLSHTYSYLASHNVWERPMEVLCSQLLPKSNLMYHLHTKFRIFPLLWKTFTHSDSSWEYYLGKAQGCFRVWGKRKDSMFGVSKVFEHLNVFEVLPNSVLRKQQMQRSDAKKNNLRI